MSGYFRISIPILLLLLCSGPPARAAEALPEQPRVHAVQSPVWVQRGAYLYPLRPGERLLEGDTVVTGERARAELDMPDGSVIKLGEEAEFEVAASARAEDGEGSFYQATLNVLKGAFRYTTRLIGQNERRKIDVRVGIATIGIRGTDVWGKASGAGDIVVLLEGRVSLAMPEHETRMLAEPLHGMMAMPDGSAREMSLTPGELAPFAAETEMRPEGAMMSMEGAWRLVVMSLRNRRHADDLVARLGEAGYPAAIETARVRGETWHRVVLPRLAGAEAARTLGRELTGRFGIRGFWLLR